MGSFFFLTLSKFLKMLKTNFCFLNVYIRVPKLLFYLSFRLVLMCPFLYPINGFLNSFQMGMGIKKVQVGKDQEKSQSEKDSHSKNRGGKKPN